jgi:hypothetical protein
MKLAKMISGPFQNHFHFGVGPNAATQGILNVQPVIPITLSENWNLITRTILPIINQPSPAPGVPAGELPTRRLWARGKTGQWA